MKKIKKIFLLGIVSGLSVLPLVSAACNAKNNNKKDYDLGLVSEPINSLNYIKFASVNKILPSLVESPLKTGPNEALKRILSLPEIPMGIYTNGVILDEEDEKQGISSLDKYVETTKAPEKPSGQFYPLDSFGNATGTLSDDKTEYQPVSVIMLNNRVQSMNALLNNGKSK
ncbi:UNVERIFIED_CONTAM: variable surface lipoprotein [Campylobacter lari]